MRVEPIEIYSDATNAAILRHPDRRFPGVLIQGDTLYTLCQALDEICKEAPWQIGSEAHERANELRDTMRNYLNHYKTVLNEHGLPLPFHEISSA